MNCKNCGQIASGNFCAHCGQSTKVGKINFSNFVREVSGSIFQVNKGFFFTLKALFMRPGESIREYIHGKRKNYFKPISYALLLSTVYFLISQLVESGTMVGEFMEGFTLGWTKAEQGGNQTLVIDWLVKHYAYTVLLLLPLYAFASYVAFFKVGYNYFEHVVLNAFIIGQQSIFYIVLYIPLFWIKKEDLFVSTALILSVSYAVIVFWKFFSEQSRISVILRTLLTYVLSLALITVLLVSILALV